jgi:hypothetical protein
MFVLTTFYAFSNSTICIVFVTAYRQHFLYSMGRFLRRIGGLISTLFSKKIALSSSPTQVLTDENPAVVRNKLVNLELDKQHSQPQQQVTAAAVNVRMSTKIPTATMEGMPNLCGMHSSDSMQPKGEFIIFFGSS